MWLPKSVYERVPQYWLMLGLLFMSSGMYLGFEYRLAYFYFGVGLVCALWSMWTFSVRLRNRTTSHDVEQAEEAGQESKDKVIQGDGSAA